ncbi:hypothetical protein MA16_Dca022824 [Dendrobium catenatum]|uniref:Uncharacterized protein n=1 Tax=Dendrobium catenatum TaxID=906689 RepID=A0A2I0VIB0_9ASPA|nr:hypothetical protein MA16_Dca022824 [Dendrobium catenatum]
MYLYTIIIRALAATSRTESPTDFQRPISSPASLAGPAARAVTEPSTKLSQRLKERPTLVTNKILTVFHPSRSRYRSLPRQNPMPKANRYGDSGMRKRGFWWSLISA